MISRDELDVKAQMRFDGDGMKVDEEVDTDLADWGLVEEEQERRTRYEVEEASQFGIDDRTEVVNDSQTEQTKLFRKREDNQMSLSGEVGGMEVEKYE